MNYTNAAVAILRGLSLSLFSREVRGLTFWWPAIAASLVYVSALIAAYYLHQPILDYLGPTGGGFFSQVWEWVLSFFIALGLLFIALMLSLSAAVVLSELCLDAIVEHVFKTEGLEISSREENVWLAEVLHGLLREGRKQIFLIPCYIVLFFIGLIPIFTPFAMLCVAWLIGFQYIDVPFQSLPEESSFTFCRRHALATLVFGLTVLGFGMLFPLSLLLPPVATAGATWLVTRSRLSN